MSGEEEWSSDDDRPAQNYANNTQIQFHTAKCDNNQYEPHDYHDTEQNEFYDRNDSNDSDLYLNTNDRQQAFDYQHRNADINGPHGDPLLGEPFFSQIFISVIYL